MRDEIEPLLFLQRSLQVAALADQTGFSLLADTTPEQLLDENFPVAIDRVLNLVLRCAGTDHFSGGEIDVLEELRTT